MKQLDFVEERPQHTLEEKNNPSSENKTDFDSDQNIRENSDIYDFFRIPKTRRPTEPESPQQPAESQQTEQTTNIESHLVKEIDDFLANPDNFSKKQINDIKKKLILALAGRSYDNFIQQEAGSELAQAAEALRVKIEADQQRQKENALEVASMLGEDVSDLNSEDETDINPEKITEISRSDQGDLEITINNEGEEKNISVKHIAALALFVTADMMLFKGNISRTIISLGETGVSLANFAGIDIPEYSRKIGKKESFNEELVDIVSTKELIKFLENRKYSEMYSFLSGLKKETREKMLTGKKFGGTFGKHQLNEEQIEMILSHLDENQKFDLDIKPSR